MAWLEPASVQKCHWRRLDQRSPDLFDALEQTEAEKEAEYAANVTQQITERVIDMFFDEQ